MFDFHHSVLVLALLTLLIGCCACWFVLPKLGWDDQGTRDMRKITIGLLGWTFGLYVAVLWLLQEVTTI